LLCRDVDNIAVTINELLKQAYPDTELDLFVARAMLELLSRSDNFDLPQRFRKHHFPTVKSPILNLVDMLPELIDIKDFNLYKETVEKYDAQVKRDPNFITVSHLIIIFDIVFRQDRPEVLRWQASKGGERSLQAP
jgi:hypothetical protein